MADVLQYDKFVVLSEVAGLIYHASFNPKKEKTGGVLIGDEEQGKEVQPETIVKLNKEFNAQNLRINTIPTTYKKPPGADEAAEKTRTDQSQTVQKHPH